MSLQEQIIKELHVQPEIDPAFEVRRTIDFLKNYLKKHHFLKTLVLGISGGQDSTLAGRLCQMAIEEMRQETSDSAYQFIAVRLPYGVQFDEADAMAAIDFIGSDQIIHVNIKESTDAMYKELTESGVVISDYNKGNIKARQRMIVQYAIAQASNGVVVGTDHAAESVTGFYTKFGDGAADVMPIWRLNKRQGRQMLEYLGAPEHLYLKVPTADLEELKPAIPDEEALGVTYEAIDDYLEGKQVSEKDQQVIEGWFLKSKHKRQLPITVFDDFWK